MSRMGQSRPIGLSFETAFVIMGVCLPGNGGVRAHVTRGPWGQPKRIRHATLGLRWEVLEVIETWQRPDDSPTGEGRPVLMSREVVFVHGPRPGRPGESSRFVMEVCGYGHANGWWLTPLD